MHRDISPGNVYIWDTEANGREPSEAMHGFVADLQLASVPLSDKEPLHKLVPISPPTSSVVADRSAEKSNRGVPAHIPPGSQPAPAPNQLEKNSFEMSSSNIGIESGGPEMTVRHPNGFTLVILDECFHRVPYNSWHLTLSPVS